VSVLFCVEHFVGLGSLAWLLPFSTAFSLWMVVRWRDFLRARWRTEAIFLAAFLYALAWRYAFPDIDASSEKITDLSFIANYTGGGRLPPVDRWLPPFAFDFYYALQHYAAALIGRLLGAGPGMAYNLGFCVLVALIVTAAGTTAMLLVRRRLPAVLLTATFLLGGVGTAPLIRQINPAPPLHASVRFIGSYLTPENATLDFGRWLLHASHVNADTPDLPVETFSYLVGLGDYHPPLSGYLLLMLALLCIAHIENGMSPERSQAVLAATVPLMIACNSWQLPLQAGLAGGYLLIRHFSGKRVDWKAVAAGFGASLLLLEPFLFHFGSAAVDAGMAIRLVPAALRTPPLLWLATFYPLVVLILLHLVCGDRSRRTVGLCLLWVLFLAGSEIFYVDDLYSRQIRALQYRVEVVGLDLLGRHAADRRLESAFFFTRLPMGYGGGAGSAPLLRGRVGESIRDGGKAAYRPTGWRGYHSRRCRRTRDRRPASPRAGCHCPATHSERCLHHSARSHHFGRADCISRLGES
jgi:hypothetical protein